MAAVFCPPKPPDDRPSVLRPEPMPPALSRAVDVRFKQAWLQMLLRRPVGMGAAVALPLLDVARRPGRERRPAVFLCDEYLRFVTVGEDDPAGAEKMVARTRQSRLIPVVANQSISSVRAIPGQFGACDGTPEPAEPVDPGRPRGLRLRDLRPRGAAGREFGDDDRRDARVGHEPRYGTAYVGSWVKELERPARGIRAAAVDAQRISHRLLGPRARAGGRAGPAVAGAGDPWGCAGARARADAHRGWLRP